MTLGNGAEKRPNVGREIGGKKKVRGPEFTGHHEEILSSRGI